MFMFGISDYPKFKRFKNFSFKIYKKKYISEEVIDSIKIDLLMILTPTSCFQIVIILAL